MPTFFVIGVAFIPIGIAMLWFSENVSVFTSRSRFIARVLRDVFMAVQVNEIKIDYTACKNAQDDICADIINTDPNATCDCKVEFALPEDWEVSFHFPKFSFLDFFIISFPIG